MWTDIHELTPRAAALALIGELFKKRILGIDERGVLKELVLGIVDGTFGWAI